MNLAPSNETSSSTYIALERYTEARLRVSELEEAIRKHMNMRGDHRCYLDDQELYTHLPEGDTRPNREVAVTIENCKLFIECRQLNDPNRSYISPQDRIEELEAEVKNLKLRIEILKGKPIQEG
jgi:hypothetical protein